MTILDSLKYWLSKKGVDSEADNIADAVKEMADTDSNDLVIEVRDAGPGTKLTANNTYVVSGSVENVLDAFSEGRKPNVKIVYRSEDTMAEVNSVTVQTYGEAVILGFIVCAPDGNARYGRKICLSSEEFIEFINYKFTSVSQ